jgi:hypothetical protein
MGMRIYKAWHYDAATRIDHLMIGIDRTHLVAGTNRADLISLYQHRSIFDDFKVSQIMSTLRFTDNREQLGCRMN